MRSFTWLLVVVSIGACGPKPGPATPAPAGDHPVPGSLQGYRFVATQEIPERDGGGQLYRFTDGSPVLLTVFVYPVPGDVQQGDSAQWVLIEGAKFAQVMPIQVQRGRYDAYEMAFANAEPVVSGSDTIPGFAAAAVTRSRGTVAVQLEYLYLLNGQFVKVRATLPHDQWQKAPVPTFARDLVRHMAHRQ
jgi:hypothetical protein